MGARLRTALLLLVIGGILAGCGSGSEQLDDAISKLEVASGGPTGAESNKPDSAPALVRRYYELLNEKQFSDAWSFLDPALQERFGGFESWRDGYSSNDSTDVTKTDVTSTAGEETDLTVGIRSVDHCDGDRYEQEFEGSWSVDLTAHKITEAGLSQISGESPPSDCGGG